MSINSLCKKKKTQNLRWARKDVALSILHGTFGVGITRSQKLEVFVNPCKCLEGATHALTVFIFLIAYVYVSPKGNLSYAILKAQMN